MEEELEAATVAARESARESARPEAPATLVGLHVLAPVILASLLVVGEHLVGFVDVLVGLAERFLLLFRPLELVGMLIACQLVECLLNGARIGLLFTASAKFSATPYLVVPCIQSRVGRDKRR